MPIAMHHEGANVFRLQMSGTLRKADLDRCQDALIGEMMPAQLKETTMNHRTRTLARVSLPKSIKTVEDLVETLMGKKPELRFQYISENARFVEELDV